jgi:hypothetical protein
MTYLDRPWRPPEEFAAGDWVPEVDHRDWLDRHRGLGRVPLVKQEGLSDADRQSLESLMPTEAANTCGYWVATSEVPSMMAFFMPISWRS